MNSTLFIFAALYPKKQNFKKAKEVLLSIVDETRKESGCLEFIVHEDIEAKKLYLYEEWENETALLDHHELEYTLQASEEMKEYLEKQTDVIKMRKVK